MLYFCTGFRRNKIFHHENHQHRGLGQIDECIDEVEVSRKMANVVDIHTSGHADRQTIAEVINAVAPKSAIIGIHKEKDATLKDLGISEKMKEKISKKETIVL